MKELLKNKPNYLTVTEDEKGWLLFTVASLVDGKFVIHYHGSSMKEVRKHQYTQVLLDSDISHRNQRIARLLLQN